MQQSESQPSCSGQLINKQLVDSFQILTNLNDNYDTQSRFGGKFKSGSGSSPVKGGEAGRWLNWALRGVSGSLLISGFSTLVYIGPAGLIFLVGK